LSADPDTKYNTKEEIKEYLESEIHKLDLRIDVASENGLFNDKSHANDKSPVRDDIIESLRITRESFHKRKYPDYEKHLSQTWGKYTDALNSKKYSWRLVNVHAIHIWIYLVAILVAIFSIYYFGLINCPVENGGGQKTGVQSTANASNNNSASEEQCYLNKAFGKDLVGLYAVTW